MSHFGARGGGGGGGVGTRPWWLAEGGGVLGRDRPSRSPLQVGCRVVTEKVREKSALEIWFGECMGTATQMSRQGPVSSSVPGTPPLPLLPPCRGRPLPDTRRPSVPEEGGLWALGLSSLSDGALRARGTPHSGRDQAEAHHTRPSTERSGGPGLPKC